MGRPTKRTQLCRELARKRKKSDLSYNTADDVLISDNRYFTEDAIGDRLDDEAEDAIREENNEFEEEGERVVIGPSGQFREIWPEIDPVYDSDTSTEDVQNTVGNIPMEWYDDFPHIGYDIDGQKVMKPARGDELDKFLDKFDDPDSWMSVKDDLMQRDVKLTDEELEIIRRIQMHEMPDKDYNPYEPTFEWFTSKPMVMPLTAAPEPKRRFVPSRWEAKKIMKIARAIREGRILPRKTQAESPRFYDIWTDTEQSRSDNPMHLPAPKIKLPEHDESYNPPEEYVPTEKEKEEWERKDPEDRDKSYLPKKYSSLRAVPAYDKFLKDRFERCLDLYLAPRVRKNKLNIDPESLIPKLPHPRDLQPFPTTLTLSYNGHNGRVRTFSIDPTGLWLVSGSDDRTIRMWEVTTGRCVQKWDVEDVVYSIAWCPNKDIWVFAVTL